MYGSMNSQRTGSSLYKEASAMGLGVVPSAKLAAMVPCGVRLHACRAPVEPVAIDPSVGFSASTFEIPFTH